jgi:uncharacterized delta-60 repeat protein
VGGNWKVALEVWNKLGDTWRRTYAFSAVQAAFLSYPSGLGGQANALAIQSDGKILVGGFFTTLSGITRNRLVRLNPDGTEDTAFYTNLGIGFSANTNALAIQSDGKILVGGGFTNLNGLVRNRLVRLNSGGTVDTAFYANLGTGFNNAVNAIAIQSDGKILVGGSFTALGGLTRNRLVRLNADGFTDDGFYFNLGTGFNGIIETVAVQSDGKILVGGSFTALGGLTRNRLVRLNADGTVDTAFYANLGNGFNNTVSTLAIQSDGKILVGGFFTTLNFVSRNYLIRLNSDGTVDTAFYTNLGTGFNTTVRSVVIQSDGAILVGGTFTALNGVTRNQLVRLNANGTVDTVFYTNLGAGFGFGAGIGVLALAIQSDGKILVGGSFTTLNGITKNRIALLEESGQDATPLSLSPFPESERGGFSGNPVDVLAVQSDGKILVSGGFRVLNNITTLQLARLNPDGTHDTAFYTNLGTSFNLNSVGALAIQSDGKILAGGDFTTLNGVTRNRLVRLNSDGTVDTAFYTNLGTALGGTVSSITLQSDGKILVGGGFTTLNGITRNRLVRLNSDGTEDTAFYTNLGTGFNSTAFRMAIQSDGKILVGGFFTTLNGVTRNRLVRLNSDGTEDTAFYTNLGTGFNGGLRSIAIQSDGKILAGGDFTTLNGITRNRLVRLNSDGTEDTAFYTSLGTAFNSAVNAIAIQSDGKILAGGFFTNLNGSSRNRLVRLNAGGTVDTAFYTRLGTAFNGAVNAIAIQSDGAILAGGAFTNFNNTLVFGGFVRFLPEQYWPN